MRTSTLRRLDTAAHWLYCPTLMVQGGAARARWHHKIHLIPGRWLAGVCDRYDQRLGAPDADNPVRNGS